MLLSGRTPSGQGNFESGSHVVRFSIVIPAYNAEASIAETLDAVLAQSCDRWECIVVDDGSTDATARVVEGYTTGDSRVRLLSQRNQGTAGAYNTGVTAAAADLIVICSADDLLAPTHLAEMLALTQRAPEHGIYSCNGDYLEPSGSRRPFYEGPEWSVERSLSFEQVLERCFFSVGATYRREVFDLVGGYRPGVFGEDYDFWLRAMARGVTHRYTPETLAVHRLSATQKSADLVRVLESDVSTMRNLIEDGWATGDQVTVVEAAIERRLSDLSRLRRALRRQAAVLRMRLSLARVIGARAAAALVGSGLTAARGIRGLIRRVANHGRG